MGRVVRASLAAILTLVVGLSSASGQDGPKQRAVEFVPIGQMPAEIKESSGVAKSDKYPDVFWTHGDSGNPAVLYAIKADGTLVAKVPVEGAPNVDWEDMAVADGFVYIGDVGNNHGWLRARTVYKFAEPNPHADKIVPIKPVASYRFKYPGKPFNIEAIAVRGEHVYVIPRARRQATTLYRLTPTDDKYMALSPVAQLGAGAVTGADVSADGRWLVTVSCSQVVCYPVGDDLTIMPDRQPRSVRYPYNGEIEACCFDGEHVVLTTEQGAIYRIPAESIRTGTTLRRPTAKPDQKGERQPDETAKPNNGH